MNIPQNGERRSWPQHQLVFVPKVSNTLTWGTVSSGKSTAVVTVSQCLANCHATILTGEGEHLACSLTGSWRCVPSLVEVQIAGVWPRMTECQQSPSCNVFQHVGGHNNHVHTLPPKNNVVSTPTSHRSTVQSALGRSEARTSRSALFRKVSIQPPSTQS